MIPRRLARPVVLPQLPHPRPSGGPRLLSGAGHRSQPREVTPRTLSGGSVSRGVDRCPVFQGFSVAGSNRQAAINSWRISVLHRSSSQYLAHAAGNAVLPLPSCSGRPSQGEISPAVSPPVLGSSGSVHPDPLVSGLPQGSQVVASRSLSIVRGVFSAGVSGSGLLVRRLGHRLGSSLGIAHRFRPLEPRRTSSLHQRQGTFSSSQGSPPLPVISSGRTISVFCDNSTAVSYLRKEGGTRSPFLNSLAQGILRWAESLSIRLTPQFIPGSLNVLADSLSRPHQLPHTEWSRNPEVFRSISRLWPVRIDLFATSENRQCSIFFSLFRGPMAAGMDAFLQPWDGLQAYAFPPWSIIPRVLAKLRESRGTELTLMAPYWPQRPWFPDLLHLSLAPPVTLPLRPDLLHLPRPRSLYQGLHRLRLHAWRLSGASRELQGSLPL